MKKIAVYRWNPETPGDKPTLQTFEVDLNRQVSSYDVFSQIKHLKLD